MDKLEVIAFAVLGVLTAADLVVALDCEYRQREIVISTLRLFACVHHEAPESNSLEANSLPLRDSWQRMPRRG